MRRAIKLSALLATLLVLTLPLKWLAASTPAEPDEIRLAGDIATAFRRSGWEAIVIRHHVYAPVVARRGPCRVIATNARVEGYWRTRYERLTASTGPVSYYYNDAVGTHFPRVTPVLADRVQLRLYPLGINVPRMPIIAVAARAGCAPPAEMWRGLRLWPARAGLRASPSAPGRS